MDRFALEIRGQEVDSPCKSLGIPQTFRLSSKLLLAEVYYFQQIQKLL